MSVPPMKKLLKRLKIGLETKKMVIHWPSHGVNTKYRVSIRASMTGEIFGIIDDLKEPCCEIPDEWGELPKEAVIRIQIAPATIAGLRSDWEPWIPYYQISPPVAEQCFAIETPVDATEFPIRLRIRSTGVDKVLLDLVLRVNQFPVPLDLFNHGSLRYKFFSYNHKEGKWDDVLGIADYRALEPNISDTTVRVPDSKNKQGISTTHFCIEKCPICGDALTAVENGQNCMGCTSRARLRSMAPLVQEYLAPRMKANPASALPLLAFAMTGAEKKFLSHVFKTFKSVSLFGSYASEHESGVDMRDLSRYQANSFAGVFGCLLFDYFPEHEQALQACFRVMAPGGIFLTHIAPYRILDGSQPPELKGAIKSRPGYFDYLPDKAELPDVKVGRDWFLAAMQRVGFEAALIKVKDAVPGISSEWFIGVKPGQAPAVIENVQALVSDSVQKSERIQSGISEVFHTLVPWGEKRLARLKFELIESARGTVFFLEDHAITAPDGGGSLREVMATNGSRDRLYLSRDLGQSWIPQGINIQWDSKIRALFSLADGGRLVRTFSGRMYHLDAAGELVSSHATGAWHWHGSQGIGQSLSGAVMYAEYAPLREADGVQALSVWRYRPDKPEDGWCKVLTLPAAVRPPQGELRHFHVCRPHPAHPNLWILASGDVGVHCRLWLSDDDGGQWHEVPLDQAEKIGMPEGACPRLLRFTQFAALDNGDLIWGTDDTADANRAALVRLSLSGERPVFHFLGWLGANCIRNIIACGEDRFLLLSESKHDTNSVDCFLFDAANNRITPLLLPNLSMLKSPITDSLGSSCLADGVGFFPAIGVILMAADKRGIFRVSLTELAI